MPIDKEEEQTSSESFKMLNKLTWISKRSAKLTLTFRFSILKHKHTFYRHNFENPISCVGVGHFYPIKRKVFCQPQDISRKNILIIKNYNIRVLMGFYIIFFLSPLL